MSPSDAIPLGNPDSENVAKSGSEDETIEPSLDASLPSSKPAEPTGMPSEFGRYRIIERLGGGGMGTVYLAHDAQLDRQVALKVPHFRQNEKPSVIERFLREARSMATLQHPNLCPVFDVGELDGVHYLTMAYIDGKLISERAGEIDHILQTSLSIDAANRS